MILQPLKEKIPAHLLFSTLFVKSRSSASFTSSLKDHAGPYPFGRLRAEPANIIGDTITCENPQIWLRADSASILGYQHWETHDGNILTNVDSSAILVDEPGMYIYATAPYAGCSGNVNTFLVLAGPCALNDTVSTLEDTPVDISPIGNDFDIDGSSLDPCNIGLLKELNLLNSKKKFTIL